MLVRIGAGVGRPLQTTFARQMTEEVLEHILFEAIRNMKRGLPPSPWIKYCNSFFFLVVFTKEEQ